jgi:hypothetical protein
MFKNWYIYKQYTFSEIFDAMSFFFIILGVIIVITIVLGIWWIKVAEPKRKRKGIEEKKCAQCGNAISEETRYLSRGQYVCRQCAQERYDKANTLFSIIRVVLVFLFLVYTFCVVFIIDKLLTKPEWQWLIWLSGTICTLYFILYSYRQMAGELLKTNPNPNAITSTPPASQE